jgi:general secretion pathway protein C
VLAVTLLVYVAFLGAGMFWYLLDSSGDSVLLLPKSKVSDVKKAQSRNVRLAEYHLFGEVGKQAVVKKDDKPKEAPKTSLRLALKGVFTSEQPGASGAIVEEIGKKTDYYGIGDTLPGNATLEEVYTDRILLRRNGRLETLAFEEKKSTKGQSRIAKVEPKKTESRKKNEKVETPQQFMNEATARLREDPAAALGSVGLKASNEGYVYQGGNPMLSGLNMKKGDVIRSVNGHNLGDIQQDKELMNSLYEQGSLEVEVMRDGASFYINYPLR